MQFTNKVCFPFLSRPLLGLFFLILSPLHFLFFFSF
jgi:hypothetical protein